MCRFWIGHHRTEAQYRAAEYLRAWDQIVRVWEQIVKAGHGHWTDEWIATVRTDGDERVGQIRSVAKMFQSEATMMEQFAVDTRKRADPFVSDAPGSGSALTSGPMSPAGVTGSKTLYHAIDAFLGVDKERPTSDRHKGRAAQLVGTTSKQVRQDVPFTAVTYRWIESLCNYF